MIAQLWFAPVTWDYVVTNTGNVALSNVMVTDDNGTAGDTSDDFNPTYLGGDTDGDNQLDVNETWIYQATGIAQLGQYGNIGTVTGLDPLENPVDDTDPSHYVGIDEHEPGTGQTPGFWKTHKAIFNQELKDYLNTNNAFNLKYEDVFDVTLHFDGVGKKPAYPTDPTLGQALSALGGGEGLLLRASTAALANAASDDLHYAYADLNLSGSALDTMHFIDVDLDGILSADEVPLCQRSCRPDRIKTSGGAGRRTWLGMDRRLRTTRWRDCCRRRVAR